MKVVSNTFQHGYHFAWPHDNLGVMKESGIFSFLRLKFIKTMSTRILLADDHVILLDGIKSLLANEDNITISGVAQNADKCLQFLHANDVDLVVTDFNMPDMDGILLLQAIKRLKPSAKIIVLSMHDEPHLVKEILRTGINGYVLKKDSHRELLDAIREVNAGRVYLSNDINRLLITNLQNPDEGKLLTDREREIVKLIAKEYSNKDIATELFISERTVETHRKNIFKKTGTNNLVGLIKFAYANNLI